MRYENIVKGRFIQRPNRFVAYVDIDGRQEKVHVKKSFIIEKNMESSRMSMIFLRLV